MFSSLIGQVPCDPHTCHLFEQGPDHTAVWEQDVAPRVHSRARLAAETRWGSGGCPDESGFTELRWILDTSLPQCLVPRGPVGPGLRDCGAEQWEEVRGGCGAYGVKGNCAERVGGCWSEC